MTEYMPSYCTLQQELDQAKHTLVSLNDNIRRIVGRDPKEISRGDSQNEPKRNDFEKLLQKDNNNSSYKRRNLDSKSVFNRLSAPPPRNADEELRPRLHSRVIRELPTRQEIVAAQCSDAESRARNRRMFGSLLGTLHKFCLEESRLKQKEDKKAKIEKKLEQQELQEKESMKKERELLFLDRKRKQLEIRKLELKMSRLKDFETWHSAQLHMNSHIKTKAKPHIYFKPCVMNKRTEKLLSESRNSLKKEIIKKKDAINREIADIETRFKSPENDNVGDCTISTTMTGDHVMCETFEALKRESYSKEEELKSYTENNQSLKVEIKSGTDCKENNSLNINDPKLSSSMDVVSNESEKDLTCVN